MSRQPRPGRRKLSPEWRARVSQGLRRYHAKRREAASVRPRDLAALEASGTVPARLAGFLEAASVESETLLDAIGGPARVSPQRRALVEDTARLGLALRAMLALFVQSGGRDGETASRLSSLAGARRSNLLAIGLDRFADEVVGLHTYLGDRQAPQKPGSATIDLEPECGSECASEDAADRDGPATGKQGR